MGIKFLGAQALGKELDEENVQFCHVPLPPRRGGGWSLSQSPVASNLVSHEVKLSEVAQSCPTLCNPVDCSPLGSSVHILPQAGILEWVAISFSG